jgi:hypothetical protein
MVFYTTFAALLVVILVKGKLQKHLLKYFVVFTLPILPLLVQQMLCKIPRVNHGNVKRCMLARVILHNTIVQLE